MNKFLSVIALCSLFLAPGCQWPFSNWRQHKQHVRQHGEPIEPQRKSGPSGWNIRMEKE